MKPRGGCLVAGDVHGSLIRPPVDNGKFPTKTQLHIDTHCRANHLFESDRTLAAIAVSRVSLAAVDSLCAVWPNNSPLVNTRNYLAILSGKREHFFGSRFTSVGLRYCCGEACR